MATKINSLNVDPSIKQALADVIADNTALRVAVAALVVDVTAGVANHNTLRVKLNADAGVTDIDYAAATAQTSVAPAAAVTSA